MNGGDIKTAGCAGDLCRGFDYLKETERNLDDLSSSLGPWISRNYTAKLVLLL